MFSPVLRFHFVAMFVPSGTLFREGEPAHCGQSLGLTFIPLIQPSASAVGSKDFVEGSAEGSTATADSNIAREHKAVTIRKREFIGNLPASRGYGKHAASRKRVCG